MISVLAMCDRIRARLAKQRKTIARVKLELLTARRLARALRDQIRVLKGRNVELERDERRRAREANKAQLRLPL